MQKLRQQSEIVCNWPEGKTVPIVVVRCLVYNHGPFIERCLQGFLRQETDFPFEVYIHDDASTDGSADIVRRYAERYPLILKPVCEAENQWRKGSGHFHEITWTPVLRGDHKYIALCEGDDYWTDPKKLQKQVEYMESHPGCAGCFHERVKCDADGQLIPGTGICDEGKCPLTGDDIVSDKCMPPTCTMLYRRDVLMSRPEALNGWWAGDLATALWAAYNYGTIDWVEGIRPSVYRVQSGGVYSGMDDLTRRIKAQAITQRAIDFFSVSRQTVHLIHRKWEREVFWHWRKWHGSDVSEEREKVRILVRQAVAAWPPLRLWLWARQIGYWMERGGALAWHAVVLGAKGVLSAKLYGQLKEAWGQRGHGGGP